MKRAFVTKKHGVIGRLAQGWVERRETRHLHRRLRLSRWIRSAQPTDSNVTIAELRCSRSWLRV